MEAKFLKDSLFAGMTSNAFKLGTVLTLGWFWMRQAGCHCVYRGQDGNIDYDLIQATMNLDGSQVSIAAQDLPANTIWHYIRRQESCCGLESEDSPSCIVVIDSTGEMIGNTPNSPVSVVIEPLSNARFRLRWRYAGISEEISPTGFKIYILPFVIVTGTPDPDCTGKYILAGTYNGRDYYERTDGEWFVWYKDDDDEWEISEVLGFLEDWSFRRANTIEGVYESHDEPISYALVTLHLTLPPPVAIIPYAAGRNNEFSWISGPLTNGNLYRFCIRSYRTGAGESQNTDFVAAVADSVGPDAITGLLTRWEQI